MIDPMHPEFDGQGPKSSPSMKCPHCSSDMQTVTYDQNGVGISVFPIYGDPHPPVVTVAAWQIRCPGCKLSGPRQPSKADAESAVRRLMGPFTLKAVTNAVKSATGVHDDVDPTSIAKRILGELKRKENQEATVEDVHAHQKSMEEECERLEQQVKELKKDKSYWHRRAMEPEQDWSGLQGGA